MPIPTTYFLIKVVPIQNLKSLAPQTHQNHQEQINQLPNQLVEKQSTSQTVILRGTANNLTVFALPAKTMNFWITLAP